MCLCICMYLYISVHSYDLDFYNKIKYGNPITLNLNMANSNTKYVLQVVI